MMAAITRSKNTFLFFTHSYFELESSGLRDEIRYHYVHSGRPRTEALPYRLADGQWHRVALSVSASHLSKQHHHITQLLKSQALRVTSLVA